MAKTALVRFVRSVIEVYREVTQDGISVANLQRVFICVQFTIIIYRNCFVK